jgi:DNA-binding CsgD family transcriptional regulator
MGRKSRSEPRAERRLLELVGDVCGLLDNDELRYGLLEAIRRALPSDYASLNEVGPGPEDIVALIRPESQPETFLGWARHAHENPLLQYYQRTQNGLAVRFSDFITSEELHATALYKEVYAPMGVEYQLAFTLPAGPRQVIAIALSRGDRDYSDAERDFANSARPFLIQAYLNAIAFKAARAGADGSLSTPLVEALLTVGLTPREAQALRLVALGRSNHHVARTLGISHRTVGKHLERAFRKLDVGDRSTAAARVWELAGAGAEPLPLPPISTAPGSMAVGQAENGLLGPGGRVAGS